MLKFKTHINNKNNDWVTFLHGFGGSSNIWHKQVRELSKFHNLLFIDLRDSTSLLQCVVDNSLEIFNELSKLKNVLIFENIGKRNGINHKFWGAKLINGVWEGTNTLGKIWMEECKKL